MLKRYDIRIDGKRAVVIGRSNIVGIPVAHLLLGENATVTVCHSRTGDIASIVREVSAGDDGPRCPPTPLRHHHWLPIPWQADIVIAAIGKAGFVKGEWLKPGATVIDVGINSVPDASKKAG